MLRVVLGMVAVAFLTAAPANADVAIPADSVGVSPGTILQQLTPADVERYSKIFAFQEDARWADADRLISQIENEVLMGYVLYQRYMHPTGYRSSYDELKRWMAYYADHPEAQTVYALALKRRPKNAAPPVRPVPRKWRNPPDRELHPLLEADYANTSRPRLQQIEGRVRFLARGNEAAKALSEIEEHFARNTITERQYDRMRSWIAASYYFQGFVDGAERIANEVANRNGETAVLAHWIGGLSAFRRDDASAAYEHFAAMARNPHQDESLRSAGAFWAARTALATGRLAAVTSNLEIAAQFPFTFYGQLALAQLGREHIYDWTPPTLTKAGLNRVAAAAPGVLRAVALSQVGEDIKADLELRWANGLIEGDLDYDLLAVAAALELPAAQIDIALNGDAEYLKACLFPIPNFTPAEGFKTDRALLYALMRQESKFKVEATSRVGAMGLMQLMPRTASYVARDSELMLAKGRNRLYDPALNLEIGQSYVNYLISNAANGNLFDLALAYNGGPGNLRRWKRDLALDDPLLFIESIPNSESRDFVEKVLTNVWIYYSRLGQTPLTRDKVAAGELPLFEALDQIAGEDR